MGLPVVATRVGGIPEQMIDGETGLLVRPRDPVALADAWQKMLADPAPASAMGRAGRDRVERLFPVSRQVSAHEALYERVIEPRNGSVHR